VCAVIQEELDALGCSLGIHQSFILERNAKFAKFIDNRQISDWNYLYQFFIESKALLQAEVFPNPRFIHCVAGYNDWLGNRH
jgi:hypothetical protein